MAKTVLIVEDNELNMKLFRDLLEAHGYQTSGTSNGIEALDLVRKLRPDLVLMDIQLPQVSGLEVTRWIKDDPELRAIPVVAVTAFAMKGDEERIAEAAGVDKGRSGGARNSPRRGPPLWDEGGRKTNPRRRLRSLFVQTDFGRQIYWDGTAFYRVGVEFPCLRVFWSSTIFPPM